MSKYIVFVDFWAIVAAIEAEGKKTQPSSCVRTITKEINATGGSITIAWKDKHRSEEDLSYKFSFTEGDDTVGLEYHGTERNFGYGTIRYLTNITKFVEVFYQTK